MENSKSECRYYSSVTRIPNPIFPKIFTITHYCNKGQFLNTDGNTSKRTYCNHMDDFSKCKIVDIK
jgi:hypothetical protein